MNTVERSILFAILPMFAVPTMVAAQSVQKASDGSMSWQAGVDGATIEFNPDGSWKRIYSKYAHPVAIADKRGVKTATIVAEEKAKGNIVRFLQQHVTSGRVVKEVQDTLSRTDQQSGTGGERVTTTDQRAIGESVTEMTGSFSSGTLTGVVVLENGYDEKEKEAWVAVGVSRKSMAAAQSTQGAINQSLEQSKPGVPDGPAPSPSQLDRAGSYTRKGNQDF